MFCSRLLEVTIVLLILCWVNAIPGTNTVLFHAIPNSTVDEGEPIKTVHRVFSDVDCASKCADKASCYVISYDNVTKECKLYDWLEITLVCTEHTSRVWYHQPIPMVSARYHDNRTMTFAEAGILCQSLGRRLTTVLEIYSLKSEGVFDKCRCGWVSEQESIRLLVNSSTGCAHALFDGVNVCKNINSTSYAWCTFDVSG